MPENMVGKSVYKGRDGVMYKMPTWRALGFLTAPTLIPATGKENLYRVWTNQGKLKNGREVDGDKNGRFFSLKAYRTRREAELHSNVMQYGNGIRHQTRYTIKSGTPMWVGKVFQGDDARYFGRVEGSQVFIDWEHHKGNLQEAGEIPLIEDMNGAFVIKGADKGQLDS